MIQARAWEHDPSCTARDLHLCRAAALERLGNWPEAIRQLDMATRSFPDEQPLRLALAKLNFKAGRKDVALALCTAVYSSYSAARSHGAGADGRADARVENSDGLSLTCSSAVLMDSGSIPVPSGNGYTDGGLGSHGKAASVNVSACTSEDAADAYHLAGWVKIHGDDHTEAYRIWSAGAAAIPDDPVLATQKAKRQCWDSRDAEQAALVPRGTLGSGAYGDGRYDADADLDAFTVAPSMLRRTPALALYDETLQRGRVVFRTKRPVLSRDECRRVCDIVVDFHRAKTGGSWGTVRRATVPTTDVAVEDIPELRPWLRELLDTRLFPMLAAAFPRLADGSVLVDPNTGKSRVRVHDAFIVRYAADGPQPAPSLPEHSDTSALSFTLALNERGVEFDGGGTWFEALGEDGVGAVVDADIGHAVAFAGPLRHAGYACCIFLLHRHDQHALRPLFSPPFSAFTSSFSHSMIDSTHLDSSFTFHHSTRVFSHKYHTHTHTYSTSPT